MKGFNLFNTFIKILLAVAYVLFMGMYAMLGVANNAPITGTAEVNGFDKEIYVYFETDGGSDVEPVLVVNDKITTPENPTKEGYTFEGWFYEDGEKFSIRDYIEEDTTLYAHWKEGEVVKREKIEKDFGLLWFTVVVFAVIVCAVYGIGYFQKIWEEKQ